MSEKPQEKTPAEAKVTVNSAQTCETSIQLLLPNKPFDLPPMAVGEPLEVTFRLIGVKAMAAEEAAGKLALTVKGYTRDTVVRGQSWSLKLPEWEIKREDDATAE